jgi:deoxyribodipyrimidine photo-lyase
LSKERSTERLTRLTYPQLIQYIAGIDTTQYAQRRNYLGGSTRLSEYVSRGAVSLPVVRAILLEKNPNAANSKLINELAWREYWQLVWKVRGKGIFDYIRPIERELRHGIPQAVLDANTGIAVLDKGIRELLQTGYIHNHLRMWLAGLICNVANCDWRTGADWMHSYLIDGDYASNHLSWQWVAGSYTGKAYLPQQDNINMYSETMQHDTYLDQPYEVLATMAVPPQLLELTTALPSHSVNLPQSTTTVATLSQAPEILLYSPWTLDTQWRTNSTARRVLLIDNKMFPRNRFSQNVIDSIVWFADQIPNLEILYDRPEALQPMADRITRKFYAGISDWPGIVDPPELLFPDVPSKFYPSFSSFWKQAQKNIRV